MEKLIKQLRDPLDQTTRKVRRNLLLSSMAGILIVKVDLVPERIIAFGIKFSESNQESLLLIISGVIIYFLLSFIIYLTTEYTSWQLAITAEKLGDPQTLQTVKEKVTEADGNTSKAYFATAEHIINDMRKTGGKMLSIRMSIEAIIPIVVSIYSLFLTL